MLVRHFRERVTFPRLPLSGSPGELVNVDRFLGTWSIGEVDVVETPVVNTGVTWNYLDDGSDQGTACGVLVSMTVDGKAGRPVRIWRWRREHRNSLRPQQFELRELFTNGNNRYVTTYFRKVIDVPDPAFTRISSFGSNGMTGWRVYLNGSRVVLDNLADGAGFDTLADSSVSGDDEDRFYEFVLPTSGLWLVRTLWREIHNAALDSSDVSFDLSLHGRSDPPSGPSILNPGMNRVLVRGFHDEGEVVEATDIEVWYDDGDSAAFPGAFHRTRHLLLPEGLMW